MKIIVQQAQYIIVIIKLEGYNALRYFHFFRPTCHSYAIYLSINLSITFICPTYIHAISQYVSSSTKHSKIIYNSLKFPPKKRVQNNIQVAEHSNEISYHHLAGLRVNLSIFSRRLRVNFPPIIIINNWRVTCGWEAEAKRRNETVFTRGPGNNGPRCSRTVATNRVKTRVKDHPGRQPTNGRPGPTTKPADETGQTNKRREATLDACRPRIRSSELFPDHPLLLYVPVCSCKIMLPQLLLRISSSSRGASLFKGGFTGSRFSGSVFTVFDTDDHLLPSPINFSRLSRNSVRVISQR